MLKKEKAYFHLPGLFEFYELSKVFLPLFYHHREYFYDWCEIGSIYGSPEDCLWGGGRLGEGNQNPYEVLSLMNQYHISSRLTFSNSLLQEKHLQDKRCNDLCALFEKSEVQSGIIIHSDLLLEYLKKKFPRFYFVSSTTKVLTKFEQLVDELKRNDFLYVVPDFRLNKVQQLENLLQKDKDKIEFLCNECCFILAQLFVLFQSKGNNRFFHCTSTFYYVAKLSKSIGSSSGFFSVRFVIQVLSVQRNLLISATLEAFPGRSSEALAKGSAL